MTALATTTPAPQVLDLTAYPRERFNVLVPTAKLQQISPWHQLRVEEVRINPDPAAGDVYKVGSTRVGSGWQDVLALSKTALMKLSAAAGIVWHWGETKVLSASRDYVLYQAVGAIRKPNGEWISLKATKEIDMAVIEEELTEANAAKSQKVDAKKLSGLTREQWADQQTRSGMIQWRKNKLMRAETGAMLRVIRALLSIKHQYSPAELQRPFIVPRVDFAPDPNDPEVRTAMLRQGARSMSELFGASPSAPSAGPELPPAIEVGEFRRSIGSGDEDDDVQAHVSDDAPPPEEDEAEPLADAPDGASSQDIAAGAGLFTKQEPEAPPCDECGKTLSDREFDYSLSKYNRPLCYRCQRKLAKEAGSE